MSGQGAPTSDGDRAAGLGLPGFDAAAFVFAKRPPAPVFAPRAPLRRRVFAAVLAVHAIVLVLLLLPPDERDVAIDEPLQIEFVSVPADVPPPPPPSPEPRRPQQASAPAATTTAVTPPPRRRPESALQAVEIAPSQAATSPAATTPARPRLYDDSGNIVVPRDALDELQRNISDDRVFDYQIAGLAKARSTFERRSPLIYEPSRFEEGMRPTQDMLSELLTRAVEASTLSISIPFPGDPSRRIECKVSVLAVGGGCGITGGFTGFVEEDDPNTLNPEEEAQCAAWWDKITTTGQQGEWLATRELYDANCLKPREKKRGTRGEE